MSESGEQKLRSVKPEFWTKRWDDGEIGWHKDFVDVMLKKYFQYLCGEKESQGLSVFLPLAGKSLDLVWLCEQGMTVAGNDIAEKAAVDFFQENKIPFKKYTQGALVVYEATDRKIKFFAGDIFDCTPEVVGVFDCIWETNSLVALNPEDRERYAKTLAALSKPSGRMLMSAYEYDQSLRSSFPYSVPPSKVEELFQAYYTVKLQEKEDLIGKIFTKKFNLPWGFRNVYFMERRKEN